MLKKLKIVLSTIIASLIFAGTATALEFQTDTSGNNAVKLDFTFGETLNITTSGNTVAIPELTPGHSGVSASNYTVTVNTNAQAGYTLSATVGCSSSDTNYNTSCYDSTSLSDGTNTFDMITADGTLSAGEWGIALVNTETVSSFKTLAKWDSAATVLRQTDTAGGGATPFRIGAAATNSQEAGTYQNRINFIAVANVAISYMQDMDSTTLAQLMPNDGDTTTLTDSRDGQEYSIAKIAGAYWMTRNLAVGCNGSGSTYGNTMTSVALDSTNSNVTNTSNSPWNTPTLSLDKTDETTGCTTSDTSGCNSYTDARMKCSSTYGAWYNYAAATAGTIASDSTSDEDVYNICPAGWTLPNYDDSTSPAGSINSLAGTDYLDVFPIVRGGYYSGGAISHATVDNGRWWSTTAGGATSRYALGHATSANLGSYNTDRRIGPYIRCIKL